MLQKLQNRAARIVTNSSYDSSASALIKTLNWPTVADMIKVETACMVYKSINDLAPDYLSEMFTKNSAYSRKNLRNTATDLQVPLKADFHSPISGARATFSERHSAITWCVSNYTSATPTQNEGFKIQSFAAYSECIFRGQSKLPACS